MTGDIPGGNGHIDQGDTQPNTVPGKRMGRRTALEILGVGAAYVAGLVTGKTTEQLAANEIKIILPEATGTIDKAEVTLDPFSGHDIILVEGRIFYNNNWTLSHINLTSFDPDETILPGIKHDPNDPEDTGNKIIGRISPQGNYYSLGVDLVRAGAKLGSKIPVSLDAYFTKSGTSETDGSQITSHTLGIASVTVEYSK